MDWLEMILSIIRNYPARCKEGQLLFEACFLLLKRLPYFIIISTQHFYHQNSCSFDASTAEFRSKGIIQFFQLS